MDFALFVALNAVLLIRPEELEPDIAGLRSYLIIISLNILFAFPRLINLLRLSELAASPISACVLGIYFAGILSQLVRGQLGLAIDFASEFGKVVLYYFLLVSVVNTPSRLQAFLGWLVAFVVVLVSLALLQYQGIIDNEALRVTDRRAVFNEATGETVFVYQLRSTGIYNDPNDLCLILVTGSLCALYRGLASTSLPMRLLWFLPIGLFGYGILLTRSRGGLLGLMAAMVAWTYAKMGWKKGLAISLPAVPAIMLAAGGRQAEIGAGADTAQARVQLWSNGLVAMMKNPLTGIGVGEYGDVAGQVAHNSFIHAYVEAGLLGGGSFIAAFMVGVAAMHQVRPENRSLRFMRPFILAMLIGYGGGIFSLTRNYIAPTYMILALPATLLRLSRPHNLSWYQVDGALMRKFLILGVAGFLGLKLITIVLLGMGSGA